MDNNNGLINNALDDDIEIMARPPEIILISSTSDESDITKVLTNEERNRNYCNNSTRSLSLASLEFPEPPNFSEIRQTILSALPNTSNSNNNEERDASLSRNEISENLQNLEKPLQVGQKRKKLKTRGERSRARSNASKRAASSDSEEEPDQTTHKSKKRLRILPIHNTSSDSDKTAKARTNNKDSNNAPNDVQTQDNRDKTSNLKTGNQVDSGTSTANTTLNQPTDKPKKGTRIQTVTSSEDSDDANDVQTHDGRNKSSKLERKQADKSNKSSLPGTSVHSQPTQVIEDTVCGDKNDDNEQRCNDKDKSNGTEVNREAEAEGSNCELSSDEESSVSSSSESISDAQNPLNEIIFTEEFQPSMDSINPRQIPVVQEPRKLKERKVEVLIISGIEFSVEIFTEHPQTNKRMHKYPQTIVRDFLALPTSSRRFEDNKFIFKIALTTFYPVKDTICKYWKHYQFGGFEDVIQALVKYSHVTDDRVLKRIGYEFIERRIDKTFPKLKPYQRESLKFAYLRQGRCMLADSSGMGKRVEAILSCFLFETDWPVIVICSTAQQKNWIKLLEEWLPNERLYKFTCLETAEDCAEYLEMSSDKIPDFTVIGYKLLQKEAKDLKNINFKVAVVDESHRIKNEWTATAQSARQIIKRAKRRFLLTSNPAFGVPDELFCQLHVIDRKSFKDSAAFADRYCGFEQRFDKNTEQTKQVPSRNWRNAKNLDELKHLLHNTVMIRHFKSDSSCDPNNPNSHALTTMMPEKRREIVKLDFQPDERTRKILGEIYHQSIHSMDELMMESEQSKRAKVFIWYAKSGRAKLALICKYLDDQLSQMKKGQKIIIYYRHLFVMDGIEKLLKKKGVGFVRIGGNYEERMDQSYDFNNNPKINVAVLNLSIQTDIGIDLTSANLVIFTELYWLPDSILHNEDRAWDFFKCSNSPKKKKKVIDIKYLIASDRNALDDDDQVHMDSHLWEMLQGKIRVLMKLDLVRDDFTSNIPEVMFEAVSNDNIDDLKFSDISSNESDHEYNPNQESSSSPESESSTLNEEEEEDISQETSNKSAHNDDSEGNGSSTTKEEEADQDSPEPELSRQDTETTRSNSKSPNDNTQEEAEEENAEGEDEEEVAAPSPIPKRRITRSMSKTSKKKNDKNESDEEESTADDEESADDENDDSMGNFIASETDESDLGIRVKKNRPRSTTVSFPAQKSSSSNNSPSQNSSASETNEKSKSRSGSSDDEVDSDDYEVEVKKARNLFVFK